MKKNFFISFSVLIIICAICIYICIRRSHCDCVKCRFEISTCLAYSEPNLYLIPGARSDLNNAYLEAITDDIIRISGSRPSLNLEGIASVCKWYQEYFRHESSGSSIIGQKTVDELYISGRHYGCHSQALILSSVLREFGFPTVMVETAAIKWAYLYRRGENDGFQGHVMTEVFVEGKWILLDNTCKYVEDYDPYQPFIWLPGYPSDANFENGLFVLAKGVDMWDYGIFNVRDVNERMIYFANNIKCFKNQFNTNTYVWRALE